MISSQPRYDHFDISPFDYFGIISQICRGFNSFATNYFEILNLEKIKPENILHYLRISVTIIRYRTRLQGHTSRGDSGALYPQSATAGVMLLLRDGFVRPVPFFKALKDGSCAISGCEPCQAGDRAALSGLADVPRGCLSGA